MTCVNILLIVSPKPNEIIKYQLKSTNLIKKINYQININYQIKIPQYLLTHLNYPINIWFCVHT